MGEGFFLKYSYHNSLLIIILLMSLKSKIIQKLRKKGRSSLKKTDQYQPSCLRSFVAGKYEPEGRKLKNPKSRLKKVKNRSQRMTEGQKIEVDLNLGLYGFDSIETTNAVGEIEELLENCESFSLNPSLQKIDWKQMCGEITRRLQRQNFLIRHLNNHFFYSQQSKLLIEINKEEYAFWECMHQLFAKMKSAVSPGLTGAIMGETESARRILKKSQECLVIFARIEQRKQIERLTEQLQFEVAFKTFAEGLKVTPIDMLNYFLIREFEQNSRMGRREIQINNWQEWTQFIQKKRVRLRKANKFLLHTACQLCLSPHSQQSNPISNCPQCHIRGHRLCLGSENNIRCGRCVYLRLSNQMKSKIPQCFICNTSSLAPIKINSRKFAHIFCLMSSQLWKIERSNIQFKGSEEKSTKVEVCKFCSKEAIYYGRCGRCKAAAHYVCAFMKGAKFQVEPEYQVKFWCCQSDALQAEKISEQRKYILNYNNIVFKKLSVLQHSSKKRRRRRSDRGSEEIVRENFISSRQDLLMIRKLNALLPSPMQQQQQN